MKEETHCCHLMGNSYQIFYRHLFTDRIIYIYITICYTSCRALAGMRNNPMGPLRDIDLTVLCILYTVNGCSTMELCHTPIKLTGRNEGNVLFNDALNTFCLQLYGIRHKVKDHSDSERGNLLPPRLAARVFVYASSHRQDSTYHSLCYTSRAALA